MVECFTKKLQLHFFFLPFLRHRSSSAVIIFHHKDSVPLRLFTVSRGRTLTSWGGVGVGWGGGGWGGAQWVTRCLRLLIGSLGFLPMSAALQASAAPQLGRTACQAPSAPISQFPSVLHLPSALHLWYFNDVAAPFNYF